MPEDIKDISDTEEYEIVPHKEIAELRRQIAELKSGAASETQLYASIERLTRSIDSMMAMFKKAADEIKLEEHDQQMMVNKIDPMMKKLEAIEDQNEKIAAAIINLAELLQEKEKEIEQDIREEFKSFNPALHGNLMQAMPSAQPGQSSGQTSSIISSIPSSAAQNQWPAFGANIPTSGPIGQGPPIFNPSAIAPGSQANPMQIPPAMPDMKPLPPLPPVRKKGLFGR